MDELSIVGEKFPAPTVEHALKWIRRIHKIFVGSTRHDGHSWLDIVDDKTGGRLTFSEIRFLDREDSDMHGLDVSIRHIENNKSITTSQNTLSIGGGKLKSLNG